MASQIRTCGHPGQLCLHLLHAGRCQPEAAGPYPAERLWLCGAILVALDEAAVLSGRVDGLDGTGNLLVNGQKILLYQAADAAILAEDLLSVGALLVLGGRGHAQGVGGGCRVAVGHRMGSAASGGQWGKGWAAGQAGLLQDKDHLLLQTIEGLMQAGQHPLVVVLVVQCGRLHSQHILIVEGMELPEAAHILLLCLVTLLVCGERLWKTPTTGTPPAPTPGQGAEGEGWERDRAWGGYRVTQRCP